MSVELRIRQAQIDRSRADPAKRTVPASLSSDAPVTRGGEIEVLRHDAASIDLSRAASGIPLLVGHDRSALPIGVVEGVRLDGARLVGVLRFSQAARAADVWQDVVDGVLTGISIGYSVDPTKLVPIEGSFEATSWALLEASLVSVPADPSVGIGRSLTLDNSVGDRTMTATRTRQVDIDEIRDLVSRAGLDRAFADQLVTRQISVDEACRQIIHERALRDRGAAGHLNVAPNTRSTNAFITHNDSGDSIELMADAVAARMGGPALKRENPYRHARMDDMARELLELRGVRTTSMSPGQIIERALHTTSDFPNLLQGAGQRTLAQAYNVAPSGMKRVCRPSTATDFRAKQRLALSEAPALLKVNEHGEYKYGTMAEAKNSYSLATFGRIFGITRQGLVNDDLDAFGDLAARLGRAAAEFEATFLTTLLTSNPTMGDGFSLFDATNHGNLATGVGSALGLTALTTARKAMRLQTGMDRTTPIDATPKFLIVPAALETPAEQLLASITPTQSADVNPFAGKLELVVDPRLDAISATAWYLAADSAVIDTIEYSYLDGIGGPEVMTREGFEVDGIELKVRLDFGAGVLDFRGLYKAAGA
ncbi:MAG: Mu-like prophage major head subunit gpT family protein [Proteobacteria bacterium]|nr:Mu-like prophage major head subunit gpT family protein [Pseudomonadota bacterium]